MASRLLRICGIVTSSLRNSQVVSNGVCNSLAVNHRYLLGTHSPLLINARDRTFFASKNADALWKGVTSVSNAGRRRGRAKGLPRRRNLNKGQIIGIGKVPIQFPGLNTPIFRGKELVPLQRLPPDPERQERLAKLRQLQVKPKQTKLSPLERGWTSRTIAGTKVGPPDPVGEDTFDGFETWILESKLVTCMTGNLGRKSRTSVLVVTGNRNGIAGFAVSKANAAKTAVKTAKNRAGRRLIYIPRYEEYTVLHDFYTQFGKTKIFVKKMYEGYGLVCHRVIKACCEALGIKDLHAKVEGSTNPHRIVQAFFIGLLQQKSHQQLADEKKLHLVELKSENCNFPVVVASPLKVRTPEEVESNEVLDFNQYVMGGRVVLKRKKPLPFFTRLTSWKLHLRKMERIRNHEETRLRLRAEYGALHSFLTEKYPEARHLPKPPKASSEETEVE